MVDSTHHIEQKNLNEHRSKAIVSETNSFILILYYLLSLLRVAYDVKRKRLR